MSDRHTHATAGLGSQAGKPPKVTLARPTPLQPANLQQRKTPLSLQHEVLHYEPCHQNQTAAQSHGSLQMLLQEYDKITLLQRGSLV